ncbi:MAG TPA: hypothetical protein VGE98_10025 [Thermoanaerobaculia bacterium]
MVADVPSSAAPYKDRSTALILVGILLLGLALLELLGLVFVILSTVMAASMPLPPGAVRPTPMPTSSLVLVSLLYGGTAVFFGWMGIGTIQARRWAGTLMLVVSWLWLAIGTFGTAFLVVVLPETFARVQAVTRRTAEPPGQGFVFGCVVFFSALFLIALPGLLVLFYRGPNVRATFAARDPELHWTERCPAPVLAIVLCYAATAVYSLCSVPLGYAFVFGRVVTGAAAVAAYLAFAAISAALVPGLYRLRPWAWWALLAFLVLGAASSFPLLFGNADLSEMYRQMGTPAQAQLFGGAFFSRPAVRVLMAILLAGYVGYLLWIRRYFTAPKPAPASAS